MRPDISISSGGNATKGVIQALKDGYPVGLLIDQDTRAKGVFVDFFGRKAHTPVGTGFFGRGLLDVPHHYSDQCISRKT